MHPALLLVVALVCAACHSPAPKGAGEPSALAAELHRMAPAMSLDHAASLAQKASMQAELLEERFSRALPPSWHNTLVNLGLFSGGLCHHFADSLYLALLEVVPDALSLHRVVADRGEYFEHSAVVVTPKGSEMEEGVVLDAWRRARPLFWIPVREDRYEWRSIPEGGG